MATLDDFNDRVRTLVRELLALSENYVRPADQNAPVGARDEPFATVKLTTLASEGQDSASVTQDPDDPLLLREDIAGTRLLMASINFYRGDAYNNAMRLKTLLSSSSAIAKMQVHGLGFIRASEARDLTAFVDSLREPRGQIDIEFYAVAGERISIPTYGHFPITFDDSTNTQSFEVNEP